MNNNAAFIQDILKIQDKSCQNKIIDLQGGVIDFIRDYFSLHDMKITGDSRLKLDLGLSSFELLEMCCSMEEEFKLEVSEENLKKVVTINDVVKALYFAGKNSKG